MAQAARPRLVLRSGHGAPLRHPGGHLRMAGALLRPSYGWWPLCRSVGGSPWPCLSSAVVRSVLPVQMGSPHVGSSMLVWMLCRRVTHIMALICLDGSRSWAGVFRAVRARTRPSAHGTRGLFGGRWLEAAGPDASDGQLVSVFREVISRLCESRKSWQGDSVDPLGDGHPGFGWQVELRRIGHIDPDRSVGARTANSCNGSAGRRCRTRLLAHRGR
jgi:hypothetical protein